MDGRKALPITSVLLILALALATVGVGYGLWSKTLTIQGTVHTGEVNAVLSLHEIDESRDFNDAYCPKFPGFYSIGRDCDNDGFLSDAIEMEYEGKDVAHCTAELVNTGEYPDLENDGPQGMLVTIRDAYPSFNCFIRWDVTNAGSVPIKIHTPKAYAVTPGGNLLLTGGVTYGGNYGQAAGGYIYHLNSWPPVFPTGTCYTNDTQLHTNEQAECNLHFHLGQLAEQGADYQFLVEVFAHQWNEEP
ncbi:MAG TPA: hypothetical protein VK449_03840 [Anaerolineales bacterium]|nr:hypothetical protein [Anaerolineales bacterium]